MRRRTVPPIGGINHGIAPSFNFRDGRRLASSDLRNAANFLATCFYLQIEPSGIGFLPGPLLGCLRIDDVLKVDACFRLGVILLPLMRFDHRPVDFASNRSGRLIAEAVRAASCRQRSCTSRLTRANSILDRASAVRFFFRFSGGRLQSPGGALRYK